VSALLRPGGRRRLPRPDRAERHHAFGSHRSRRRALECQGLSRMSRRIKLHEIAHARAGDKGNTSNVSVWVYDPGDYPLLKEQLTADRIKAAYPALIQGAVKRYALDHLHGLNFVMQDA